MHTSGLRLPSRLIGPSLSTRGCTISSSSRIFLLSINRFAGWSLLIFQSHGRRHLSRTSTSAYGFTAKTRHRSMPDSTTACSKHGKETFCCSARWSRSRDYASHPPICGSCQPCGSVSRTIGSLSLHAGVSLDLHFVQHMGAVRDVYLNMLLG